MIKPAFIFTDRAVLQHGKEVIIWGECSSASLYVSFNGSSVSAKVENGRFEATLPPMKPNTRGELRFTSADGETLTLRDIVTGEVWIAGGQSNMEHPTFCTHYGENALTDCDDIRFFTVPRRTCFSGETHGFHFIEKKACDAPWETCTRETALEFTAVGYFFAAKLYKELRMPIGVISCNWGATKVENWTDEAHLAASPLACRALEHDRSLPEKDDPAVLAEHIEYQAKMKEFCNANNARARVENEGVDAFLRNCGPKFAASEAANYSRRASVLRHSMLERITPYTLRGVIWYQGESNTSPVTDARDQYKALFNAMTSDWREAFRAPSLPFYTVQISAYVYANPASPVREAQWQLMEENANIYTVLSYDIGEKDNIHPAKKQIIGERLADAALTNEYGITHAWRSPIPLSVERSGDSFIITYNDDISLCHTGERALGIYVRYSGGDDFEAEAILDKNKITVKLPKDNGKQVALIEHAQRNFSICNIYTSENVPIAPFSLKLN